MPESTPHTLTILVMVVLLITLETFYSTVYSPSPPSSLARALLKACVVFLVYASLQLQDGELSRPHPVVWRIVHGVTILYCSFLVFLLGLNDEGFADESLRLVFDREIGNAPLARFERNEYSMECGISLRNVLAKVDDRFFWAHFLGWVAKALILRNWGLMWTCSIMFEVLEITLQTALPNFQECWWDRWLLDVFGCNLLGMGLGMRFGAWWGARGYDWSGINQQPKLVERLKASLTRPRYFPRTLEWHAFASWKQFGVAALVVLLVMFGEVNGFLLKSALQIPTNARINVYRVLFIVPAVYASIAELFAFSEGRTERIGRTAWLVLLVGALEFLLSAKSFYKRDAFRSDQLALPSIIVRAWALTFLLGVIVAGMKLSRLFSSRMIRVFGRLTILPFAYLLFMDAWESGGLAKSVQSIDWGGGNFTTEL